MTNVFGVLVEKECPRCEGSGREPEHQGACKECYGSGMRREAVTLEELAELLEPVMTKRLLDKRSDKLDTAPNLS